MKYVMKYVRRNEDQISIVEMEHPRVVGDFIEAVRQGKEAGFSNFSVNLQQVRAAYPDVLVPFFGLLESYKADGISFQLTDVPDYIKSISDMGSSRRIFSNETHLSNYALDTIWKFEDSKEINSLVNEYIDTFSQEVRFGKGVLEALSWSLYEVMDNVLQHSGIGRGYAMAQIHPKTQRIAFCVFDAGQGIFNSLKNTRHRPRYPIDAITLAIKEGVTRDTKIGQGNGLWGLYRIIKADLGSLFIVSHGACYRVIGREEKVFKRLPLLSAENGCTTVFFRINYQNEMSLSDVLGSHKPIDLRVEALEDARGSLVFRLKDKTSGTGTRQAGMRMRNDLMNLFSSSRKQIDLDFTGIAVVSSSFADELVGKLVTELGFSAFSRIFRLINMNDVVEAVVNRSVVQRLSSG